MSASKKNVIASMMAYGVDSVKYLSKAFVLINVLGMDIAVVVFVRYSQSFHFFSLLNHLISQASPFTFITSLR